MEFGETGNFSGTKKPELLIPAGSLEVLRVAVNFGADAVYIGGEEYGLRAKAKNFSLEDIREGIAFAHARGVRVYLAVNIFAHNADLDGIRPFLEEAAALGPDALIISDPGVFAAAREICPEIEIHISTQANNTNYGTFNFWHGLGAKRVVAARELSLEEIADIRSRIPDDLEIEAFVHGAMCISYSGRCLLSNYFTGRDANRGECTHPCRWRYAVAEETRPGQYLPLEETKGGTYVFNAADLCMIGHIPDLVGAGIDSFKVEGRMKNALYAASVTRAYRRAVDDYFTDPGVYTENIPRYMQEVRTCTYRKFSTGFYYGRPDEGAQVYDSNTYSRGYTYLGIAGERDEEGLCRVEQKNKFSVGEEIEIMKPDGRDIRTRVERIRTREDGDVQSAPHPGQILYIDLGCGADELDILRRREEGSYGQ